MTLLMEVQYQIEKDDANDDSMVNVYDLPIDKAFYIFFLNPVKSCNVGINIILILKIGKLK